MKISVIVPNLSGEIYLQDCEASLAAQSADRTVRIGAVAENDYSKAASKDNGFELEIITEEDDKNSPKGVAAMRNLGLEAASGDFVFFLDSDDYISDNALRILADEAVLNPGRPVALKLRKTRYKRDAELAEEARRTAQAAENADDPETDEKGKKTAGVREPDSVLGILIPAEYVKGAKALRFREDLKYYSDIPFMAELIARSGEICTVPERAVSRGGAGLKTIGFENAKSGTGQSDRESGNVRTGADSYGKFPCVYYKRSRNDAIRYPALSQIKDKKRYAEFDTACRYAQHAILSVIEGGMALPEPKNLGGPDGVDAILSNAEGIGNVIYARMLLWEYICGFIYDKLTKAKHPEGLEWDESILGDAARAVGQVHKDHITSNFKGIQKRILLRLHKGKAKAAQRLAKLYVMNRKKKGLFGSASQWRWNIYKRIFRKLPVKKNLFLFESFLGKSYGDSCRAIYEYMITQDTPIDYVWVIDNKDARIPGRHKECKPLSLKYFYYVARCGAWVSNMRQPAWYEKREGVRFLETWHGTPLKKLVFDMDDVHSASPEYKMTFYKQSRIWDWLVSDNRFSTDAFESAFLFPREKILELGYPRNDLLYGDDRDARAAKIREKLGIPADKKVVLYAPTWRDDDYYGPGQYKFELPLDLNLMESLKDEYFFILRTHYFIADHLQLDESKKQFVMDCSRYNDIGELYLISDVLITDYSSVFFDYANLRRPILFYVYDFEKYRDTLRGFYFDMETGVPGPLLFTNEEVLAALKNIDAVSAEYSEKYREFTDKFCSLDDGHAAERVVKAVFEEFQ